MSQSVLTEAQLHLAVEQLRTQYSNTIDLYKAVAALLFFQYGSTPTTNRMYQLVRKGSMGAPAEALRLFWQELRERTQVRMEQADLPSSLTQSAGILISQLWEESLQLAQQATDSRNQAIHVQLAATEQAQAQAVDQAKQLQHALLISQQQLQSQDQKIEQQQQQAQQLQLQLATQLQQTQTLNEQKQSLETQHAAALLSHKEQLALSQQRAADMEKYARLEIEHVRQDSIKTLEQEQKRFTAQQQNLQRLQSSYQEQQKEQVELQQQYHYQGIQLKKSLEQQQQLEQKNQDLHALLHQLQQQLLTTSSARTTRTTPSRLAKNRAKKTANTNE